MIGNYTGNAKKASILVPYSLGDAIDWKPKLNSVAIAKPVLIPYSLGDAIDWKHQLLIVLSMGKLIPYSLGDAIDWKLQIKPPRGSVEESPTR